ncbi:MAG: trypsin-like serine protease [Acidimicrobiales bacterium]
MITGETSNQQSVEVAGAAVSIAAGGPHMRQTHRAVLIGMAVAALAATGLVSPPTAQAGPNCTPDAVTAGLKAALGSPAPVGTPYSCAKTVYPGAKLRVAGSHGGAGGGCTANFLFRGSNDRIYLGTAGHCTLAATNMDGDRGEFRDPAMGALVQDGNGTQIGRVEYAIQQGDFDIALIRLRQGITYDTALPHWGPVTGINGTTSGSPIELRWVGHGTGVGNVLYARSGLALGMPDANQVYALGAIAPGDSGGPVVDGNGKAIGVNVAIGASLNPTGVQIITRLAPQLEKARHKTGITFTLLR